jgi:hypothetical protein
MIDYVMWGIIIAFILLPMAAVTLAAKRSEGHDPLGQSARAARTRARI